MQDLTRGSITGHLIKLAVPIAVGMLFQTLYYLVDLYFVSRLGEAAIAGVSAAGNVQFLVMALTQVLGVGAMALIAQAIGRQDSADAGRVFNQSALLGVLCLVATLIVGYLSTRLFMGWLADDAATIDAGVEYLHAFMPGLALQFALVVLSSALRGAGVAKPTMLMQMVSVLLNAVLSPVLIAGWGTGRPFGVAGAGWASSISVAVGVVGLYLYFSRLESFVGLDASAVRPHTPTWGRIVAIGFPAGSEFGLLFFYTAVTYAIIAQFGPSAQAGFGIGARVMQAVFLPAMAVAFAVAPVAGQNFGAKRSARVRRTVHTAFLMGSACMLAATTFCRWKPQLLISLFTDDPAVLAIGSEFLRLISLNFVAIGLVFASSGLFQALGNTWPSLLSSGTRIFTYVIPGFWLAGREGFSLAQLWYLSVGTVALQALLSVALAQWQMRRRLGAELEVQPSPAPAN